MTVNTPNPTPAEPTTAAPALGLSRAKKAWTAGVAGAVTAAGAVSLSGLWTAHGLDAASISTAAGSIVGGFVLGFVGAYFPRNV